MHHHRYIVLTLFSQIRLSSLHLQIQLALVSFVLHDLDFNFHSLQVPYSCWKAIWWTEIHSFPWSFWLPDLGTLQWIGRLRSHSKNLIFIRIDYLYFLEGFVYSFGFSFHIASASNYNKICNLMNCFSYWSFTILISNTNYLLLLLL